MISGSRLLTSASSATSLLQNLRRCCSRRSADWPVEAGNSPGEDTAMTWPPDWARP